MNPPDGRDARDEGMDRVLDNNPTWHADAWAVLLLVIAARQRHRGEFTGEDLTTDLQDRGIPHPPRPQAWGALIGTAVRAGLLIHTGRMANMQRPRNHARRTPIYRARNKVWD